MPISPVLPPCPPPTSPTCLARPALPAPPAPHAPLCHGNPTHRLARSLRSSASAATTSACGSTRTTARASSTRRSTPASPSSTRRTSTASTESEVFLGRALAGRRDAVVIATKFGMSVDADATGRATRVRAAGGRRQPAPSGHRPHRSLSAASARSGGADRGHARRARRSRPRGQGPRNRLLELLGRAAARRAGRLRAGRGAVRQRAERAQPAAIARPSARCCPSASASGWRFCPYFPLASGLLTGKYRRGEPAPDGTRLSQSWAASRFLSRRAARDRRRADGVRLGRADRSVLELAVSWLASRPIVASVIAGATSPEQVRANAAAAGWQSDRGGSRRDRHDRPKPLISPRPPLRCRAYAGSSVRLRG